MIDEGENSPSATAGSVGRRDKSPINNKHLKILFPSNIYGTFRWENEWHLRNMTAHQATTLDDWCQIRKGVVEEVSDWLGTWSGIPMLPALKYISRSETTVPQRYGLNSELDQLGGHLELLSS